MATGQLSALLRLLASESKIVGSDRELLERFVTDADEVAFAGLVERHARLVFRLCRSVLQHDQDAEDAFQATFLVLARLGSSIRKPDSLASWLHGVALRTALKARRTMTTRRRIEQRGSTPSQQEPVSEAALREVQAILHEEIARLPDKFRTPFVLCCLEGKSRPEAAQQLGWKEGTVSGRIAQARALLESRLARRGVALGAALAAAALLPDMATATVPTVVRAALAFAAGRSPEAVSAFATSLAEGVIQAMLATKMQKAGVVMVVLAIFLVSGSWLAYAASQPDDRKPVKDAPLPELAAQAPQQAKPPADASDDQPPKKGEPNAKTTPTLVAQTGHDGHISAAIQSADGKWLVTGGYDSTVKLWNLSTGILVRTFEMQVRSDLGVYRLALVGNNKWLVAQDNTNRLTTQIWELATGKVIYRSEEPGVFAGLSADGKVLAMSAGRYSDTGDVYPIRLLDTASGKIIREIAYPHYDAVFDAEGKRIILADKGVLRCLDSDTGKVVFAVRDANLPGGRQFSIMPYSGTAGFSADGHWLWAVTGKTVRMWDTRSGKMERSFAIPKEVYTASISTNGKWLVTQPRHKDFVGTPIEKILAEDQLARLWDTTSGKEISTVASSAPLRIFNGLVPPEGDAKHLVDVQEVWAAVEGKAMSDIVVREAATAKVVSAISTVTQRAVANLVISRDGKWLVANNPGNTGLLAWDLSKGKQLNLPNNPFKEIGVHYINYVGTPNPVLSDNGKLVSVSRSKAHLWDLAAGKYVREFVVLAGGYDDFGPDENLTAMTVSQDGKWLATGLERIENGRERRGIKLPPTPVVRLWDLTSGKAVRSFGKDGRATTLTFGAGDRWLLEGDDHRNLDLDFDNKTPFNYRARLWDVAAGKEVRNFEGISPFAVALTNDGKFLASAQGHDVVLHDLAAGKDVRTFKGHPHDVSSVAFSADGKWLVAGSSDYKWRPPTKDADLVPPAPWEARVWEVATGKLVNVIRQPDVVIHVSLSRDGKRLLTHTEAHREWHKDNAIRVWDVATGKLLCQVPRVGHKEDAGGLRPRRNCGVLTDDGERLIWIDHDQSIRVSDAATGKELCRLVSFANGAWVVYDTDGRFDSADDGKIKGLHWAVGLESRPFNELRDRYYDPGLLAKHLGLSKDPLRKLDIR